MKRRVRLEYAGTIFACLLFVLLVGVIEILDTERFRSLALPEQSAATSTAVESPVAVPAATDCLQSEAEFAAKLEGSRSCMIDADCSLARLECPFECVTAVSQSLLDALQREQTMLQQSCRRCESSCPETLVKWRAACVRQRCILLDRSIEDLEEETLRHIGEAGQ